jgi:hypothetical protein
MAFIHVLVATGVAMVGVGAGGLLGDMPKHSDLSNIKVGMVLLEVAWGVLVLWGLWTLWNGRGRGWKSGGNRGAPAGLAGRGGWLVLFIPSFFSRSLILSGLDTEEWLC